MPYKDPQKRREMARLYTREWNKKHPEKRRAVEYANREKNWDRYLATNAKYRQRHRDRVRESMAKTDAKRAETLERKVYKEEYKRNNPEKIREWNCTARVSRKLSKSRNGGEATIGQWLSRCEMYGWKCAYCLCELDDSSIEIEHVIPVSRGGTGWPSNLVPACRSCNAKKHARRILPLKLRKES